MRIILALAALLLFAAPAQAGDRPNHGQGYHSSWDDADSWKPRGQGDILNFPDYHLYDQPNFGRYYDPFYWQHRYPRDRYRDGISLRYDDGDFSASLRFGDRGHRGNRYYRPLRGHPADCPCYNCTRYSDYNRVYYSPDGVSVSYLGYPDYTDYYYSNIRPADRYYRDQQDYLRQQRYLEDLRREESYRQEDPQTINIYNYYTGDPAQAGTNGPDPNPPARFEEQPPVVPPPTVESGERPWGRLFHGSALFTIDEMAYNCELDEGALFVGPEMGPGRLVAENIDESLGVLATYHPQEGLVFVFVSEGRLTAAYESVSGWGLEPLPVQIDFGEGVSLGNMGGFPWVVFNDTDGTRYVYSYSTAGWQLVGSGSPPPPAE